MPSFLFVTSLSNICEVPTVSGTELFLGDHMVIDNSVVPEFMELIVQ